MSGLRTRARIAAVTATAALLLSAAPAQAWSSTISAAGAAGAAPASASAPSSVWGPPLAGEPVVLTPYTPPARRWLPGHRGVDLAAAAGQVVLAPSAGTVTFAGTVAGVGVVVVTSAGGWRSTLEPVTATAAVGTRVRRGQAIGVLAAGAPGDGGHCAGAGCLHWGVVRGRGHAASYRDPLALLHPRAPILLPCCTSEPALHVRPTVSGPIRARDGGFDVQRWV